MDEHLDRLLAELGERSNAEIAQIQSEGRATVDTIRRETATRIADSRAAAIHACEAECTDLRAEALAAARSRARSSLLRAQHGLVDRVLDRARTECSSRFASSFIAPTLVARVEEMQTYAGDDGITLRCRPELSDAIRGAAPSVEIEVDAAADWGVVLSAGGGRLVVDDTLTTWFERERPTLAMTICRRAAEGAA